MGVATRNNIEEWISKRKSLNSLNILRARINKRMSLIRMKKEYNPLAKISIDKKREIIKELFVKELSSLDTEVKNG